MLILPSILVSLLLFAKIASCTKTLAPYFAKKTNDHEVLANNLLTECQHLWPGERLTVQVLKRSLEAGEIDKISTILRALDITTFRRVLDAMLHPSCTPNMLKNVQKLEVYNAEEMIVIQTLGLTSDGGAQRPKLAGDGKMMMVIKQVYIHQSWETTKEMLAGLPGPADGVFNIGVVLLIRDALDNGRYKLMKMVLDAVKKEWLPGVITKVLNVMKHSKDLHEPIKLFLLNDTGKNITPAIFKVLRTRALVPADLAKLLKHSSTDNLQFARIMNELVLLNEKTQEKSKRVTINVVPESECRRVEEGCRHGGPTKTPDPSYQIRGTQLRRASANLDFTSGRGSVQDIVRCAWGVYLCTLARNCKYDTPSDCLQSTHPGVCCMNLLEHTSTPSNHIQLINKHYHYHQSEGDFFRQIPHGRSEDSH